MVVNGSTDDATAAAAEAVKINTIITSWEKLIKVDLCDDLWNKDQPKFAHINQFKFIPPSFIN